MPFGSKEIRAATATTGKIETPTLNILSLQAGISGYRNYIGYGPKKTHLLILKPFGNPLGVSITLTFRISKDPQIPYQILSYFPIL